MLGDDNFLFILRRSLELLEKDDDIALQRLICMNIDWYKVGKLTDRQYVCLCNELNEVRAILKHRRKADAKQSCEKKAGP